MLIMVSTRIVENATYPERRDALSHEWGHFFDLHGLVPILIPNSLKDISAYFSLGARGLLLTGGDNLGPPNDPTARDKTETQLIAGALERHMPILGVCRGLQMLNRYFGGEITALPNQTHVGQHHVRTSDAGRLEVNSFHNQAVLAQGLSPSLRAFAHSDDGVVEGLRHADLPVTAIQWHPERPSPSATYDESLIRDWIKACA